MLGFFGYIERVRDGLGRKYGSEGLGKKYGVGVIWIEVEIMKVYIFFKGEIIIR